MPVSMKAKETSRQAGTVCRGIRAALTGQSTLCSVQYHQEGFSTHSNAASNNFISLNLFNAYSIQPLQINAYIELNGHLFVVGPVPMPEMREAIPEIPKRPLVCNVPDGCIEHNYRPEKNHKRDQGASRKQPNSRRIPQSCLPQPAFQRQ